ncbi:hypothetical protein LRS13_17635 [Svornostia abyssi]|uniref:MGS-like domain-containing protein n=1 Tax=Svornostia abyssi TaxID=2898438 RepID=A0ABY5PP29_9ACTN|nr:hypothetical protein LRS13_17635 [Parviterribacteraceae bacterium J379]
MSRAPSPSRSSCTTSASGSSPRPGRPRRSATWASRSTRCSRRWGEGSPNVVDWIENGEVTLVINTPTGSGARSDGWEIRRAAVAHGVPCITTLSGGVAAARAIAAARTGEAEVLSLQELHPQRLGVA